jgi:heat-inducible transcriptional repressor
VKQPVLDERSRDVLRELIQAYLATGEPVASESIAYRLRHPVSSATVRSILGRLERLGLLDQPHTSAGRVPTDVGLRLFVDNLMAPRALSARDAAAIESWQPEGADSPSDLMESATQLLSKLTGNVAFALAPDVGRTRIRHLDFVRLSHSRVLAVLVSRSGFVTHRIITIQDEVSQEQLEACTNHINRRFSGLDLATIRRRLIDEMHEDKRLFDRLLQELLSATQRALSPEEDVSVYLGGTANILRETDVVDVEQLRALFRAFEEKSRLVKILSACLTETGVRVVIGCETLDPDLKGMTLVATRYGLDGELDWGLGIMGPTRMEYPRVVTVVNQVAQRTRALLTQLNS